MSTDASAAPDGEGEPTADGSWTAAEIRRVGHEVVDLIAAHLTELPGRPVFRPYPNDRARRLLAEDLPARGLAPDDVLRRFRSDVEPWPFGNGHPRFHAWVNGPPDVMAVFADALAAAMNPSVAGGNHAATYVELQVVRWLGQLVGYPDGATGLLVSGGSAATLHGLAAARHVATAGTVRTAGLQGRDAPLVVYTSDQGHSAIGKAVEVLGLGSDHLRVVPSDADRRLRVDLLERALDQDLAAGRRPMAVAASAGTVSTGAVDPLDAIADICARHGVWLHVDGAYGAPAALDPDHREALGGLRRADSLALDAHKWLSVPYEAGAVLVRDGEALRATFSLVAPYLREEGDPKGVTWLPWLSEYGLQQTRGFRALKVWMALLSHGRDGYAHAVSRDIALARRLREHVLAQPRLELVGHGLSIVCFRVLPTAGGSVDPAAVDALNRDLLRRLQLGGEAFLSSTVLDDRLVLRACFVNARTAVGDVDHLVALVLRLAETR